MKKQNITTGLLGEKFSDDCLFNNFVKKSITINKSLGEKISGRGFRQFLTAIAVVAVIVIGCNIALGKYNDYKDDDIYANKKAILYNGETVAYAFRNDHLIDDALEKRTKAVKEAMEHGIPAREDFLLIKTGQVLAKLDYKGGKIELKEVYSENHGKKVLKVSHGVRESILDVFNNEGKLIIDGFYYDGTKKNSFGNKADRFYHESTYIVISTALHSGIIEFNFESGKKIELALNKISETSETLVAKK